jgi:hypothetical protein
MSVLLFVGLCESPQIADRCIMALSMQALFFKGRLYALGDFINILKISKQNNMKRALKLQI